MKAVVIACNQAKTPYPVIPAGPAMLAQRCQRLGVDVALLDLCFEEEPLRKVVEILSDDLDFVAISFRNLDNMDPDSGVSFLPLLAQVSKLVKACNIPLYVGGAAIGVAPELIFQLTQADLVFAGSAEAFAQRVVNNDIPEGVVRDNSSHCFIPENLEKWVDMDKYFQYERMIPLRLKLGCPFQCSYCTYSSVESEKGFLEKSSTLEKFLRHWIDKNVCIDFVDSIFNEPSDWALSTLKWLKERRLEGNYHISAFSPMNVKRDLLKAMTDAGATAAMIGVDSGSDIMLKSYNKPFRMANIKTFMDIRKEFDLSFFWTFVAGGPEETYETLEETMTFIESLPSSDVAYICVGARIYPHTKLYAQALEENVITGEESPMEQPFYFSRHVDRDELTSRLISWGKGVDNVMLPSDFRNPHYLDALESLNEFQLKSPGWKHLTSLKKLMLRREKAGARSG